MARTARTFSRGGRAEAKAGENTGQGKSGESVTEKADQTNQQEISPRSQWLGVRFLNTTNKLLPSTILDRPREDRCDGDHSP